MIIFFLLINYFVNFNFFVVIWNVEYEKKFEYFCLICYVFFFLKNESFMFRFFYFFLVELVNEYCLKFFFVYNFFVSIIIVFYVVSLYVCLKVN